MENLMIYSETDMVIADFNQMCNLKKSG